VITSIKTKGYDMTKFSKKEHYPNTPSTTLATLGTNVKAIYLEKKDEIFGPKRYATDTYQDGNKKIRVDYYFRFGLVIIFKIINPGYGQPRISKIEKLVFS